MPYTVDQLRHDERFRGIPREALEIFVLAFNAALETYNDEGRAFAAAWTAVQNAGWRKSSGGEWVKEANMNNAEFAVTKTEDGVEYPAEAYAYVPDPEKPSTWKLRLWEDPEAKVTVRQLGRAAAALSPGGFRGNRVEIPKEDLPKVKARIRAEYRKLGVKDEEMPESVRMSAEAGVVTAAVFDLTESAENKDEVVCIGKLFECGEYPDKEFSLSEEEADAAIAAFEPVPNDLEHKPTILAGKLGRLERVWRQGKEIFGRVIIPRWLKEAVGEKPIGASLAFDRGTKRIVGNALVLNPRVPDAALVAAFSAAMQNTEVNEVNKTSKPRQWYERLKALFAAKSLPEELADFDPQEVVFREESAPDQSGCGGREETAEMSAAETEAAALRAKLLSMEAERFYEKCLQENRVVPAEREPLIALFVAAARDDNAGQACFTAAGELVEGERLQALKRLIAARPAHRLTKDTELVLLSTDAGSDKPSQERLEHLLRLSGYKKEG